MTITGTDFTGATAVKFGVTNAASFTVNSDTQITAVTPAHADGQVDVSVTTPDGTAISTNAFVYVPPPTITSVSQDLGPTTGGTPVIVTGTNFKGPASGISWTTSLVTFGDTAAACTVTDATHLSCSSPAHAAGTVLRYVGRITARGEATVGLAELDARHAFANIALTDNVVRFSTSRYCDNALIVQGPGAGPAVTAGGVFADLLRLSAYLGARL
ncbi:MAG: IPT/TIG domain-containing protein [Acidobacteria bacterium]|nr:IPT/TIG domain-containing protein [Acidobacteriota bacterium]